MSIPISSNSLANRRLYLRNRRTLVDFAAPDSLEKITLGLHLDHGSIEPLPADDLVSVGTHALRLHAADVVSPTGESRHPKQMSFTYTPAEPLSLAKTPLLTFAFSAYDGERTSLWFAEVAENKYFVERPDPQLVSHSYLTVTLEGDGKRASRTIQITNYGFNRLYANFSGESVLSSVSAIRFDYLIDEDVPGWQRILKLDRVDAAMAVDYTLGGSGLESLFSCEGGEILHKDGLLSCTFAGDFSLTLPDMTDAADTICDVFLPIKNTLLLRMDASVPEMDLTVAFKTDEENFFSPDKQKTFHLSGIDTPRTLFLNLSDHPRARGRLCGMRLIPAAPTTETVTWNIRKIAFEQEKKLGPVSGRFLSCVADTNGETINFTCEVDPAYAGKTLRIYDVFLDHIHPDLNTTECISYGVVPKDGRMTLSAPLYRVTKAPARVTRIASQFLGVVTDGDNTDGAVPFAARTLIENWQDICGQNPYPFTLPDRIFDVTSPDFGAVGDGFTNDTDAIQSAIDAASEAGGGVVLVPGGTHPACGLTGEDMGRRYVITNLTLRSFVELRIETGAVLWQADDTSYYRTLPRFGHNVSMTGVNWPANHSSGNFPLIYAFREQNVRITGGGTIRMCDTESQSEDGYFKFIGDNVCRGCCDRMHVAPFGLAECESLEVSNLTVIRSSGLYMFLGATRRGYIANLIMDEPKCTGADGFWPTGSDEVCLTRILLNTNDDGICLSGNYNDPRDMLWCFAYPGDNRSTRHIEFSHSRFNCYTFTGSAVSFCLWGTNSPKLQNQEVHDIHIFDNVLEGRLSIGGWTDNPYYGVFPFNGAEVDDFSPVRNLRVHDCELKAPTGIGNVRISNFENDLDMPALLQFERGDFLRRPAEQNPGWELGLANWSYTTREAVEQILLYGTACALLKPVRGKVCDLYQGLTLSAGEHTMCFKYKAGGTFRAFVRTPADLHRPTGTLNTGEIVATKAYMSLPGGYREGYEWVDAVFTFTVPSSGLYHLGVMADFRDTIATYVTDFELVK